jgi:hypothetical protein
MALMIHQNIVPRIQNDLPRYKSALLNGFFECLTMTAMVGFAVLATLIIGL